MITLIAVTIGIPAVFMSARLLLHALAPNTHGTVSTRLVWPNRSPWQGSTAAIYIRQSSEMYAWDRKG
jgi:hypothetical protein